MMLDSKLFESEMNIELLTQRADFVVREFFNGKRPDENHNFRVTDRNFKLSHSDIEQLLLLGSVTTSFLDGIGKIGELSLVNDTFRNGDFFTRIRQTLDIEGDLARRRRLDEGNIFQGRNLDAEEVALSVQIADRHPFMKIDLARSLDGKFTAVEIDPDKVRGFGYATLNRECSQNPLGWGLAEKLARMTHDKATALLIPSLEEFYRVEAKFFASRVNEFGGNLFIVDAERVHDDKDGAFTWENGNRLMIEQTLMLPKLKTGQEQFAESLIRSINNGRMTTLSDRSPMLGQKGAMALIRNDIGDEEVENLLNKCLPSKSLEILRSFIPQTFDFSLLKFKDRKRVIESVGDQLDKFWIKAKKSSGAHGVAAPGETEKQIDLLSGSKGPVIVQETVPVEFHRLPFIDLETRKKGVDDFSIRFCVFASGGEVMDLGLTASPSAIAHGSPNSIQMGADVVN